MKQVELDETDVVIPTVSNFPDVVLKRFSHPNGESIVEYSREAYVLTNKYEEHILHLEEKIQDLYDEIAFLVEEYNID